MRVLAGDLGGTKTRLGLFESAGGDLRLLEEKVFASEDHEGLGEIVAEFLEGSAGECGAACFGIAGAVTGRRVRLTNLPWEVDADDLAERSGIPEVHLINDLEATAWGLPLIGEEGRHVLNAGREGAVGNQAVIAAGTGLGEAGIYWDGQELRPFASEGGHASFSPTDELVGGLMRFLRRKYETVSWERVVSGPGLVDLYRYLHELAGTSPPEWFEEAEREGDAAAAMSKAALEDRCHVCSRALELFARLYGEEAGNLALKMLATGGVWVGGGIAPKILPALTGGAFMMGFTAKGRMRPLLEAMPVTVVLDDRAALFGAARYAAISS